MPPLPKEFSESELDSIYAHTGDRFIVSLIVGYSEEDLEGEALAGEASDISPKAAAKWTLELTRDEGARGTHWFVFDRKTGQMHQFEQHEFDPEMEGYSVE